MHVVFAATGIKHHLNLFEKFAETRMFPLPGKDAQGRPINQLVQGALRPIKFYDYVFPKEQLNGVLKGLNFHLPMSAHTTGTNATLPQIYIKALQKALKLKKIPKVPEDSNTVYFYKDHCRLIPIGIREDKEMTFKSNGQTHEGL